jgi:uncharacterized membrane protein YphA (DoxX/SURF4 family)
MDIINQYHYIIAAFIARVFLGCLFFFQGYDAVFNVKIRNIISTYENDFANNGIPRFMTVMASWFTSLSALTGGALLILGLFEYAALYLLSINLIVAAVGFGINTPVWDTRHVFPRLLLTIFLLALPQSWNTISLDHLLFKL